MPRPLLLSTVAERTENYCRDNYLFLGSVIKGVALAAATVAGLKLFAHPVENWPQIVLFFSSLLAIIVSYVTWSRGVLLTNARANLLDTLLPLWMGIMEFGLFGILMPDPENSTAWRWWFFIFFLHTLGAVGLVANRLRNTKVEEDFHPDLWPLAKEYLKWMRANLKGASFGCVLSLGLWLLIEWIPWANETVMRHDVCYSIAAALSGLGLLKPILDAEKERRQIVEFVRER